MNDNIFIKNINIKYFCFIKMYFISTGMGMLMLLLGSSNVFSYLSIEGNTPCSSISKKVREICTNAREYSVRSLVRNHYQILKNESFRKTMNQIISKYYDISYLYYKLNDNDIEIIDTIRGLFIM